MAVPHLTLVAEGAFGPERDASVVQALRRGAAGASFAAWARLRPQVDRTLRRLMGPDEEIEDLSQEVFLRFFSSVPRLRDPGALGSFLFGICLRVTRKERRSRWLRRVLRLTTDGELPERAAAGGPDAEVREVIRRYYRVLDRLGPEARSLFIARTIDGQSLQEVAALHGLSISTAQRRLARATRRVGALVAGDPVLLSYVRAQAGDGEEPT